MLLSFDSFSSNINKGEYETKFIYIYCTAIINKNKTNYLNFVNLEIKFQRSPSVITSIENFVSKVENAHTKNTLNLIKV
jgi:hypothetical protein